jgi:hypothetical protein
MPAALARSASSVPTLREASLLVPSLPRTEASMVDADTSV